MYFNNIAVEKDDQADTLADFLKISSHGLVVSIAAW